MADSPNSRDVVHATFTQSVAALAHHQFSSQQLRGSVRVSDALLSDQPITLYDVNGQPLFHDYSLLQAGSVVGTIRTAANRRMGSPVISICHTTPGWSPASAWRLASETLHSTEPNAVIQDAQLVVYANPKIGIRFNYLNSEKQIVKSPIFDAASGHPVATSTDRSHQFTQYSLLDSLPPAEVSARVTRFEDAEKHILELKTTQPGFFQPPPQVAHPIFPLPPFKIFPVEIIQGTVLLSPYCPNSPIGLTHYSQITDYFCVDASAQMLMEHYGWNYTQNTIAVAMNTSASIGGTNGAGLTSGFASLTHNSLPLTFDDGATRDQQFQDAVNEISANRPLFTQVPHHYRVCVGYSINPFALAFLGLNQMLYIYDPWPWNTDLCQGGAIYWESWATSPVEWFGIVHHA
jgi:hypothetical protein